jgi:hypothetical protein
MILFLMEFSDIFLLNTFLNNINKINTGYMILDIIGILLSIIVFLCVFSKDFKKILRKQITIMHNNLDKTNTITFILKNKVVSKRFKSIMYWVNKQNNPSVKKLVEILETKYSSKIGDYEEVKQNCYRVNQFIVFEVDKHIYGKVYYKDKEVVDNFGKAVIEEIIYLDIFSDIAKLTDLQDWVEKRFEEYETHIRTKLDHSQMLIEIGWKPKDRELDIYYNPWSSNATFENRFFTEKDLILNKINFFINNPDWYRKRGLPWTLGFLIWGNPGCGKTGFIKALMNLTGRHGITIKLNDKFNLKKLKEIIYDDELCNELIISQNKKIIILEDIDCMGDIIKDRKINNNRERIGSDLSDLEFENVEKKIATNKLKSYANTILNKFDDSVDNENNNLSYLLNILDGLQESQGRIIIMTTNKPEVLDSALVREGRIDYKIEFTNATIDDIKNILNFYWKETSELKELLKALSELDETVDKKYSHAQIVNMCRNSESIIDTISKINKKN